jgi:hypothetical protein
MMVEEEILYPALKLVLSAEEVDEGIIEHNLARNLIFDLMAMTGHEETYKVKVHVLGEEVMHHIDEEDRGLLEHARKTWEEGKIDLDLLGYRLCDRRQDWYDRIAALGDDGLVADVEPVGDAVEEARSPQSVE